MNEFTKFPSLESFGHVWRNNSSMLGGDVVPYRAKVKLHGTNAAIRVSGGVVTAQKRTSDVTPDNDNAGFANWLEPHKDHWATVPTDGRTVIFHGEWAGPGVQKGDAVSLLSKKHFFIFSAQVDDVMFVEPAHISAMLPADSPALDDVIVLPWSDMPEIEIDFSDPIKADEIADRMSEAAEAVGERDPFIYETFGIDGPGEGHVWVPSVGASLRDRYSAMTFKVKAARHGAKKAKAASRKVEIPDGAKDFVDMFVTEARCMQGLHEACDGVPEKTKTGDFLKWMGGDVKKESEVELADSGLEWKQVAKLVNSASAKWFMEKCSHPFEVA